MSEIYATTHFSRIGKHEKRDIFNRCSRLIEILHRNK